MVTKKYRVLCANHHFITYIVEAKNEKDAEEQALCGEYLKVIEDQFYIPDEFKVENVEEIKNEKN